MARRPKDDDDEYWMQKASKQHTKGSCHRMMGVPQSTPIPFTFLRAVVETPIGEVARNPTDIGKKRVKVTKLLKQRANMALNMKVVSRRRGRESQGQPEAWGLPW